MLAGSQTQPCQQAGVRFITFWREAMHSHDAGLLFVREKIVWKLFHFKKYRFPSSILMVL